MASVSQYETKRILLSRTHAVGLSSNYSFIGKGSGKLLLSFVLSRESNTAVAGVSV